MTEQPVLKDKAEEWLPEKSLATDAKQPETPAAKLPGPGLRSLLDKSAIGSESGHFHEPVVGLARAVDGKAPARKKRCYCDEDRIRQVFKEDGLPYRPLEPGPAPGVQPELEFARHQLEDKVDQMEYLVYVAFVNLTGDDKPKAKLAATICPEEHGHKAGQE